MERKKILFLIHDLKHGGAEKVLVNLVNNMDCSKFDITVMTLFDVGVNKQFLSSCITYKTVFKKEFRANRFFFRLFTPEYLFSHYIKEKYDVMIAYLEGSCTRIIGGCTDPGVKKIAWRHIAETPEVYRQCFRSYEETQRILDRFDRIIGVSESVVENFLELSGFPPEKTGVIYNTNETEQIKALAEEPVDCPPFEYEGLKMTAVGKVISSKGYMRLAKVHARLQKEGYRYKIYVLGTGEERSRIEHFLEENGLSDSFYFLGYDTNPYKYVKKSSLFICPSFMEGFSTATTEALIVGTPVLTTLCPGMEEMLGKDNEFGVIVENSEEGLYRGMKQFLDHPECLHHYREKAAERGELFKKESTVKSAEDLIDGILQEKG